LDDASFFCAGADGFGEGASALVAGDLGTGELFALGGLFGLTSFGAGAGCGTPGGVSEICADASVASTATKMVDARHLAKTLA
jgi:hypothetical protein